MKLTEHQGKELFKQYDISIPEGVLLLENSTVNLPFPVIVKAQITSGNRLAQGGISIAGTQAELSEAIKKLLHSKIAGEEVTELLVEPRLNIVSEYYLAITYSTDTQSPVFLFSDKGGTGVDCAESLELDILQEDQMSVFSSFFQNYAIVEKDELVAVAQKLWTLFIQDKVLLAEINPLAKTKEGKLIAVDAKIILDDAVVDPKKRPMLDLGGDIAVIASGGGASMLNIDTLVRSGGHPANYVEYSGNPPASVVEEITLSVLSRPGLRGAWVVGGTANFTDIYETMAGFVAGLRKVTPKPTFPIVIRRDGPRAEEAKEMLRKVAHDEGYNITVFGPEISMADSAKKLMQKIG